MMTMPGWAGYFFKKQVYLSQALVAFACNPS
jgi:hypothetical protein